MLNPDMSQDIKIGGGEGFIRALASIRTNTVPVYRLPLYTVLISNYNVKLKLKSDPSFAMRSIIVLMKPKD